MVSLEFTKTGVLLLVIGGNRIVWATSVCLVYSMLALGAFLLEV